MNRNAPTVISNAVYIKPQHFPTLYFMYKNDYFFPLKLHVFRSLDTNSHFIQQGNPTWKYTRV